MLQPVGPLPESVYWHRRAVAIAVGVGFLLVGVWAVAALAGGEDDPAVQTAAVNQSAEASKAPRSSNPPSDQPPPPNASVSGSPAPTSGPLPSGVTSEAAAPPPPPPPPPGPPPGPCPDQAMRLTAEIGQPEYKVGQRPELRLVIANSGQIPCYRDLDAGLREIVVTSVDGGTRLWSSNDCYASNSPNSRLLQPGESQMFKVAWAGRTSTPGCAGKRTTVQAGDYLVVPKLGALAGQPTPIRLN